MSAAPRLVESALSDELSFERASATPIARAVRVGGAAHRRAAPPHATELTSLADVQRWFQTVVTDPSSIEAGALRAGAPIASVVDDATPAGAYEGLDVYHHAYRARLVECLADDFPALRYAVGEEGFYELASRYISVHPSRSPNLNGYGSRFEAFCRGEGAGLEPGRPSFLGDLASLEWSLVDILHAEDAPPLPVDELTKLAPELWNEARFLPSPTFRLCRFDFPVNDFFQAFKDDLTPEEPEPASQSLAVYRRGFTLWRMVLASPMAHLLRSLVEGVPLGRALSDVEALSTDPLAPSEVMAWFSAWVQGGFFRGIELPGAGS